jgi:hypothetical protein
MDIEAVAFVSFILGKPVHSSITLLNPKTALVEEMAVI